VEHRSYCKLHELHECSSFQVKPCIPNEEDLAKYGVDVNKISEEDYNRAIAQLKNEIQNGNYLNSELHMHKTN
jgi:anthranilate/para-aminobenzoate synthase component I